MPLLSSRTSHLVIIDAQARLLPALLAPEALKARLCTLLAAATQLAVPVTVTEQYPAGLGPTDERVAAALPAAAVRFEKMHFSALGEAPVAERLDTLRIAGRGELILCGAETHVCVLQSVIQALERGFRVAVVTDAVTSRRQADIAAGLQRMRDAGAMLVTTEMVIFEWLQRAGTADFKALAPAIRTLGGDS